MKPLFAGRQKRPSILHKVLWNDLRCDHKRPRKHFEDEEVRNLQITFLTEALFKIFFHTIGMSSFPLAKVEQKYPTRGLF